MFTNIKSIIALMLVGIVTSCYSNNNKIIVGAEQPNLYLHQLQNKNIALMVNQTSKVEETHLVDYLYEKGIRIETIFAPEHGFRGEAANGETVNNSVDVKTGIPILSLYGKKKKAEAEDLEGIDMVVFDIQDVGCRFYTYISSMFYIMEACAENDIEFLVLDRPNPNGDYVAGSMLDPDLKSFVGLLPIPIVHGCTVGELAQMINGEHWLTNEQKCKLEVVPVKNYDHHMKYSLPIPPSPNLPNDLSIRLYPSLCFFEASNVSIGRGTSHPFQVIGFPNSEFDDFCFTPQSIDGVSKYPLHENKLCCGIDLRSHETIPNFTLKYFTQFFNQFENSADFWKSEKWIGLLSGDKEFYTKLNQGWTEEEILESWQPSIDRYKTMRKQYLLYPDFE